MKCCLSEDLVDVKFFPIPKIDITTEIGKTKLDEIISKGPDWPYFPLQISQETLNKKIIPVYFFPIKYGEPPFPADKVRTIKYQVLKIMDETELGEKIIYGYPISYK